MEVLKPDPSGIERAVALLRQAELVAFPTETVYGLGADASRPEAVGKIFAAKGRPADHPLIVHLPEAASMTEWVIDIPGAAWTLAEWFWPGPMALVLNKQDQVSDLITGGQATVGLRIPQHPVAQSLLQAFGGALAAPSANRFGRISPTTAQHVRDEFARVEQSTVAAVMDGGQCPVGVESSIIDLSGDRPRLLRPGMISIAQIEQVLGESVEQPASHEGPRSSGRLASHYAPTTAMAVMSIEAIKTRLSQSDARTAVLALQPAGSTHVSHRWQVMPGDPRAYAHNLYTELRRLDQQPFDQILVEQPPQTAEWTAINDRLKRAAHDHS
ncbi:MAG: L-threonylcarbamoyladenylate synthase [Pseudomonadota bacterium]